MINIEISINKMIELLENNSTPQSYFEEVPIQEFWKGISNGKTVSYSFKEDKAYFFNFKSLYLLLSKYIKRKITYPQLKFLLEVISLLIDDWDFEEGVLEEITFLSQHEFKFS